MTQTRIPLQSPVVSPTTGEVLPHFHPDGSKEGSLGIHVEDTSLEWRHDRQKELINKVAWAVGTFYSVPYSARGSVAHGYAARIVRAVLRDHGYPGGLAK